MYSTINHQSRGLYNMTINTIPGQPERSHTLDDVATDLDQWPGVDAKVEAGG